MDWNNNSEFFRNNIINSPLLAWVARNDSWPTTFRWRDGLSVSTWCGWRCDCHHNWGVGEVYGWGFQRQDRCYHWSPDKSIQQDVEWLTPVQPLPRSRHMLRQRRTHRCLLRMWLRTIPQSHHSCIRSCTYQRMRSSRSLYVVSVLWPGNHLLC